MLICVRKCPKKRILCAGGENEGELLVSQGDEQGRQYWYIVGREVIKTEKEN